MSRLLRLAVAYKAKLLCSGVFVSKRDIQSLLTEDLGVDDLAPLKLLKTAIDPEEQTVIVSCLGRFQQSALYRPGLGGSLLIGATSAQLRQQGQPFTTWFLNRPRRHTSLPVAAALPPTVDSTKLAKTLESAFTESDPAKLKRTRAIVMVHQGQIIAERYAPGFSSDTPMLGWSMTKSVINALIGILVHQGKLSLADRDLFPEWRQPEDRRRQITLDHLLRMSSGLQFSEQYDSPLSDATTMLFQRGDAAAYALQSPLIAPPDHEVHYASGTTILLCRIMRQVIGGTLADYFAFPYQTLFDRLGMASAVLEPDAAGIFTGSSFMYATAQDWAKIGMLYLQDGYWQGEQILPSGWVKYSTTPNSNEPRYAAHFWLQPPFSFTSPHRSSSLWPQDAYLASGYQGQLLTVIPSHNLVVVRLGLAQRLHSWDHEQFIEQVIQAVRPIGEKAAPTSFKH